MYAGNSPVQYNDPLGLETNYKEAEKYFRALYGKAGDRMLRAFKKGGGVWEFGDVLGDVDVDYWGRKGVAIQIEEDVHPLQAALLMRQGLEDALPYYGGEFIGEKGGIEEVLKWHRSRAGEAAAITKGIAEGALSAISVVNEGADWALAISDLSEGKWAAAAAFLPGLSAGTVRLMGRGNKALDTNAIIAAVEGSASNRAAVEKALGGAAPIVSRTAVKEFLKKGNIEELRSYLRSRGGRVGRAPPADLVQELKRQGLKEDDAWVVGSAIQEGVPLLTRDRQLRNKVPGIGEGY